MKNKILLELYLPAAEKSFEIRVPKQIKVAQAVGMLVEFLKKRDEGYLPTEDSVLCDLESGRVFDANAFIGCIGLQNGSRVMLV
ncbi:MAG: hypothetical protein NC432_07380 [Roseburia sp.]|nr:hypothetical protein [Roseburia sp.]MCM1096837.1 hypothetical protein [Ruminococcus flavefaciens]